MAAKLNPKHGNAQPPGAGLTLPGKDWTPGSLELPLSGHTGNLSPRGDREGVDMAADRIG